MEDHRITAIAVDLDGTLLTSGGTVCPGGASALRDAASQGLHIIIATARNPVGAALFAVEVGLGGPLIGTNGAQVWASPDGPVWLDKAIPRDMAMELACLADMRGWELAISVGSLTYWMKRPGMDLRTLGPHRHVVARNVDSVVGDPIRIVTFQLEAIIAISDLCANRWAGICRSELFTKPDGTPDSLVLTAYGCDKGSALLLVCERLGINPKGVMAIGDNRCDLAMAREAGLFVAMGNSEGCVRDAATHLAPTNDREGVRWAVEAFALRR